MNATANVCGSASSSSWIILHVSPRCAHAEPLFSSLTIESNIVPKECAGRQQRAKRETNESITSNRTSFASPCLITSRA